MTSFAPTALRPLLAAVVGALVLILAPRPAPAASGRAATPIAGLPIVVAVSTPVFADIIANVGGDRAAVWSVIPVGADPHTWEASPREVVRLQESDTFISMGADLEPFVEAGAWRRAAADAAIPQLELAEHVDLIAVDRVIDHGDHVHDLRGGDPHVWLDPLKTVEVVDAVERHLAGLDPAGAAAYAANADAYRAELRRLDAEYRAALAAIPPERRRLVVAHDAYTYFAARYGFEVVGIVLPHPDGEPSARDVAELLATIEATGVGVVFAEPQFGGGVPERLAAEAGIEVGVLMTDTFDGDVDTYLGLMRFNLASLVAHLAAA